MHPSRASAPHGAMQEARSPAVTSQRSESAGRPAYFIAQQLVAAPAAPVAPLSGSLSARDVHTDDEGQVRMGCKVPSLKLPATERFITSSLHPACNGCNYMRLLVHASDHYMQNLNERVVPIRHGHGASAVPVPVTEPRSSAPSLSPMSRRPDSVRVVPVLRLAESDHDESIIQVVTVLELEGLTGSDSGPGTTPPASPGAAGNLQ